MATNVLMIDELNFVTKLNAKVAEYRTKALEHEGKNSDLYVFHSAVAVAMHELGAVVIDSAKVEKWD